MDYQTDITGLAVMLDGLSLVASVITLVAAVTGVVKKVKTFYRASEELEELLVCTTILPCKLMLNYAASRSKWNSLPMFWLALMIIEVVLLPM